MVFNDTTDIENGLIQKCEFWTGLGYGNISGDTTRLAEFTGLLNDAQDYLLMLLLESMDEFDFDDPNYTDYPIATFSLVANQQDYPLTSLTNALLKIKRLELKMDGTNWVNAEPIDVDELEFAGDTTSVNNNFSSSAPRYDLQFNSIFLYPVPSSAVTNGAKIYYDRNLELFAKTGDDTKTPAFDRPFHPLVAMTASRLWNIRRGKQIAGPLSELIAMWEARFIRHYGSKQKARRTGLQSAISLEDYS